MVFLIPITDLLLWKAGDAEPIAFAENRAERRIGTTIINYEEQMGGWVDDRPQKFNKMWR